MLTFIRRHLSYANVMATMAVFIALGGGAIAAGVKLKANQVKAKNIKAGAVTEAKIADNAVNASKIKPGVVGIEHAKNSLHQNCPGGTTYQQGGCIEDAARATANWTTALTNCYNAGGRLADTGEMAAFRARGGAIQGSGEWTVDISDINGTTATRLDVGGQPTPNGTATSNPYRCVFQPLG